MSRHEIEAASQTAALAEFEAVIFDGSVEGGFCLITLRMRAADLQACMERIKCETSGRLDSIRQVTR